MPQDAPFERIAPLNPAAPVPAGDLSSAPQRRKHLPAATVLATVAAVLLLATLVFVSLPRRTTPAAPVPAQSVRTPAASVAVPAPSPPPPAPASAIWNDPAVLRTRQTAQEMAARFASQSAALHGQAVERWAAAEFAAANADAAAAAQAFEQREYGAARDAYGKALAGLAALAARANDESAKALAAGAAALNRGDGAAAAAAFSLALAISPNDPAARHGQARVQTLGAVMAKVEDGRAAERAGDLQAAAADYRAALTLDPDTASARQALIRVETTLVERGYRRAVAAGLTALERNDLDTAEQAFTRAGKLHPGTAAVRDGLARVRNARRDQRIAELRQQAAAAERAEDWDSAVARYRAVLALDSTLSFAQSGLARSQPRAVLAQRLQFFIRHPQRLDTASVYAAATSTLDQARDVTDAGPVLRRQIDALTGALQVAATPLPVQLVSDGITQVAVYKVGALGRFQTRNIDLRPGHYVAVGTRPGYRDVRIEFDVTPGAAATGPIEVRCQERV